MIGANTKWFSLKRRLLFWILFGVTLAWGFSILLTYRSAHAELDELLDARMVQKAGILLSVTRENDDHDDAIYVQQANHPYSTYQIFQLWNGEGRLLLRSEGAPPTALATTEGFSETIDSLGKVWRHYAQWNNDRTLKVIISEDHFLRDQVSQEVASRLIFPAILGVPVLGAWIWLVMWRGFLPVNGVAQALNKDALARLKPPRVNTAPLEIQSLLESLDSLLSRVERAVERERRFTADAAHELRTPLAAIATQAHVLSNARNPEEKDKAIQQIEVGTSRAVRLIEQLLILAKIDDDTSLQPKFVSVALDRLLAELCAEAASSALSKNIELELECDNALSIDGQPELLQILFRNVIDNALRYTPHGGRVTVRCLSDRVEVGDDGPGIPVEKYADAFKRFRRLDPAAAAGSGLGLSIVRRIAELHDMELSFRDNDPGLVVALRFPSS